MNLNHCPRRMRRAVVRTALLARSLLELSGSRAARAEPEPAPAPASALMPAPALVPAPAPAPGNVEDRFAKQQAQIDALMARAKEQDTTVAALREQAASAADEASSPTKLLSFWGFSDLTFGDLLYDNDHALYKVETPYHDTFFSSGINLYAKSEMTRTLSAMVETRLTYTPNGFANNWPTYVDIGSTNISTSGTFTRTDTTTQGPYSQLSYRQDGILIERAYLEWKPTDWFGVRAGRFLTPFGIWNEDHGSPVLIGIDYPQFMNFNLVPLQQLGLEAFGSVGLTDDLRAEYALTFANSNGPSDEYKDLTAMKALGARLKFVYTHNDFYLRLGGYAYYNNYVNSSDGIAINLTPALTVAPTNGVQDVTTTSQSFNEMIVTGDLDIRIGRLRLLAEFARQSVIYKVPPQESLIEQLIQGVPVNVTTYEASHYGYGGYVMGAYEIPFRTKVLDFSVMPYVGYDLVVPSTAIVAEQTKQVRGGLNVKPSPYVTLKVEASRIVPTAAVLNSAGSSLFGQLAYSF